MHYTGLNIMDFWGDFRVFYVYFVYILPLFRLMRRMAFKRSAVRSGLFLPRKITEILSLQRGAVIFLFFIILRYLGIFSPTTDAVTDQVGLMTLWTRVILPIGPYCFFPTEMEACSMKAK